jgi:hypothetical protein
MRCNKTEPSLLAQVERPSPPAEAHTSVSVRESVPQQASNPRVGLLAEGCAGLGKATCLSRSTRGGPSKCNDLPSSSVRAHNFYSAGSADLLPNAVLYQMFVQRTTGMLWAVLSRSANCDVDILAA